MSEYDKLLAQVRSATDKLREDIAQVDAEVRAINAEGEALMATPVSREQFRDYLVADIQRRADLPKALKLHFERRPEPTLLHFGALEAKRQEGRPIGVPVLHFLFGEATEERAAMAYFWHFGETIGERFVAAMDEAGIEWGKESRSLEALRERLTELDKRLAELSGQRSAMVAQLAALGAAEAA